MRFLNLYFYVKKNEKWNLTLRIDVVNLREALNFSIKTEKAALVVFFLLKYNLL